MPFDVLSDVLKTVRLTGAAFFDVPATSPFVAEQPPRDIILPMILPGAERLIAYHAVTEGECYATIIAGETHRLQAGEVVVFTNGDPHVMSSAPGMRGEAISSEALASMAGGFPFFVKLGVEGPPTVRVICGFLACDAEAFNPLLDDLPPVIVVGGEGDAGWLSQFAQIAASEMAGARAGRASVLAKLSELMFIAVVRRHIETMPPQRAGWLAGLRDPAVRLAQAQGSIVKCWFRAGRKMAWRRRAKHIDDCRTGSLPQIGWWLGKRARPAFEGVPSTYQRSAMDQVE